MVQGRILREGERACRPTRSRPVLPIGERSWRSSTRIWRRSSHLLRHNECKAVGHASPSFLQFNINQPEKSGRKECFRAIEESAAYVAKGHLTILESITHRKIKEVVFCGGASKGVLWPRILSDVLGVRVKIPVVRESTALGAAICAGVGVGIFPNVHAAARQLVKWERVLEPDTEVHQEYSRLYRKWSQVYGRMLALVNDGILEPMWRAAGT